MRSVPDVAAVGDPNTGMLVGQTQSFSDGAYYDTYRIGGTSLASPLFAGVMAVAEAGAGHAIGFANPKLYSLYGSADYRDVTAPAEAVEDQAVVRSDFVNGENSGNGYVYSLRGFGFDGGLTIKARSGYDDITGVGTPNGTAFLAAVGK